jgi:diguanylate cyclase (GGDEF)-like protein
MIPVEGVDLSDPENGLFKALVRMISNFCVGITLLGILAFVLTRLWYGMAMEVLFLFGYAFILFFSHKRIRFTANILTVIYILNAALATLIVFPRQYGFHYFLLIVPSLTWNIFKKGDIEKYFYTLFALIAFYLAEFTTGFSSLHGLTPYTRLFFGSNILLLSLTSMACMNCFTRITKQDNSRLSHMACTDSLTGLENRRFFDLTGERDFEILKRENKELSVLMIDLDHFKAVNDSYGHGAGDKVLEGVGQSLKGAFRNADKVCRYGGEEFLVLLKGTGIENSLRIAEEVRNRIQNLDFVDYPGISITASIGVSHMTPEDHSLKDITLRSDKALYYAKDAGRNCVKDDHNNSIIYCSL